MRKFAVVVAAATLFVAGASVIHVRAAPVAAPGAIRDAANGLTMIERAQFIWLGRNYCWYDDGWNGPGWYWCGQYLSSGIGWGGGYGWHHWHGGHPGGGHAGHAHAVVAHGGHVHAAVGHTSRAHAAVSHGGSSGGGHARAAVSHGGGAHGGGHASGGHAGGGHGGDGGKHH